MKIHKPFQIAWSRWVVAAQVCRVRSDQTQIGFCFCGRSPPSSDKLSAYYASANTKRWANTIVGWPAITWYTSPAPLAKKNETSVEYNPPSCQQTQTAPASASEVWDGVPARSSNSTEQCQHYFTFQVKATYLFFWHSKCQLAQHLHFFYIYNFFFLE